MFRLFLYIDPATSAYIIQIIAGIVISCGVVLGIFRAKIMMFFRERKIARIEKQVKRENIKKSNKGENHK